MNVDIVRAVGQRAIPSVPEPSAVISLLTALPTVWGKKYNRLHT
ncbi:MAG: PEP-CTERM sorting domain-containing protein [Crocosphaera sp.]|nr:PEP-CTERM sorting domain-containing protein [Crocosphaera sp.]